MDHRITQCPRCGTSFRVTEAHLAVAAGAVRCGSCLHIFNAREHWAEEKPAPAPEPASTPEPDLDDIVIDDDALFDDNTPLFAHSAAEEDDRRAETPLFDAASRRQEPLFNEIDFSNLGDLDETGGDRATDGDRAAGTDDDFSLINDTPEELTSAFNDEGHWEEDSGTRFGRVQDLDAELAASDEEWARDLLRDDEPLFAATDDGRRSDPNIISDDVAALESDWNDTEDAYGDSSSNIDNERPGVSADIAAAPTAEPALEDFGLAAAEPGDGRREPTFGEFDTPLAATSPLAEDLRFLEDDPLPASTSPHLEESEADAAVTTAAELDLNPEFLETPPAHRADSHDDDTDSRNPAPDRDEPEIIFTDASYISPVPNAAPYADIPSARSNTTAAPEHDPLASLDRLASEPLQIHHFKREPRWPGVLWGLALVVLALTLAGQYVYKNFDSLARSTARPWLKQACDLAGCVLPPQADASQIRSGNLIVRSHPNQRGALVVDAIITNLAGFPQPYPQLQLQFSDLNGTPVAGRRFQPTEYLAGELSGAALMPVQQPVHIALELVDPGPQAVNYALTVVSPTAGH